MPFGLRNAGSTYQRAMQNIFDDMLHKWVECYVDDLVVKTKSRRYHLVDLRIVFERLRKFDLKMNPLKCEFGVTSGKFLVFIVCHRGIEVDPAKIDTIQKMPKPKNLRDLRTVKGQALANFLVDHPLPTEWELSDEFPYEDILFIEEFPPWTMFFDGSARRNGAGAGVVLISPERQVLPFSFVLGETCSHNAAEYQALIIGLEMALEMMILQLEIYGDSKLILSQLLGSYEVIKKDLFPYYQYASGLLEKFDQVFLNHVPREENCKADALAILATMMALGENDSIKVYVCHRWVIPRLLDLQINESHHTSVRVIEEEDWRQPLIEYLEHGKLPE
ncbi:PREDICTED: uncharacterized protein LOC109227693 [Nicotiana attenuata]|uniref:uncharacterized protein LOC109227693 n=1 Tax=Nicotiana attenuata TaxID=49451 RepID=UPI0009046BA3|nr:PREDICTED: uncharacterized protein LOC109227693 [Nicotiana attenuata]